MVYGQLICIKLDILSFNVLDATDSKKISFKVWFARFLLFIKGIFLYFFFCTMSSVRSIVCLYIYLKSQFIIKTKRKKQTLYFFVSPFCTVFCTVFFIYYFSQRHSDFISDFTISVFSFWFIHYYFFFLFWIDIVFFFEWMHLFIFKIFMSYSILLCCPSNSIFCIVVQNKIGFQIQWK